MSCRTRLSSIFLARVDSVGGQCFRLGRSIGSGKCAVHAENFCSFLGTVLKYLAYSVCTILSLTTLGLCLSHSNSLRIDSMHNWLRAANSLIGFTIFTYKAVVYCWLKLLQCCKLARLAGTRLAKFINRMYQNISGTCGFLNMIPYTKRMHLDTSGEYGFSNMIPYIDRNYTVCIRIYLAFMAIQT